MHLTFRNPQLWLYLLGAVTFLLIALRRVLLRQKPLNDELYSKTVAIEHVQSGVAWVRADGTIKTINAAYATILNAESKDLLGREWFDLFAQQERKRLEEAYAQMLLLGKWEIEAMGKRSDGTYAGLDLLLVAVHDHKMRFVGHHCLVIDRTKERLLNEQVQKLAEHVGHSAGAISAA